MHGSDFQFFYAADQIYLKRVKEAAAYYQDILSSPFQFNTLETIIMDPDKVDFPKNESARKETWRKRLKFMTLERYSDLLDQRNLLKNSDSGYKSDVILEKESP